jgi:hypothetical protein
MGWGGAGHPVKMSKVQNNSHLIYKADCLSVGLSVPGRLANRSADPRQTWPGGSSPPRIVLRVGAM